MHFGVSFGSAFGAIVLFAAIISSSISFVPSYFAGIDAVETATTKLGVEVTTKLQSQIGAFFSEPRAVAMHACKKIKGDVFSTNSNEFSDRLLDLCPMAHQLGMSVRIGYDSKDLVSCDPSLKASEMSEFPSGVFVKHFNYSQVLSVSPRKHAKNFYSVSNVTWAMNYTKTSSTRFDPTEGVWYTGTADPRWGPLFVGTGGASQTGVSCEVQDAIFGRGIFHVKVQTRHLMAFVDTVSIARTGSLILWDPVTEFILGGSHLLNVLFVDPVTNSTRNAKLSELDSALVSNEEWDVNQRQVPSLLLEAVSHHGAKTIANHADTDPSLTFGSGREKVFVSVVSITDEIGLNLKMMVVIPHSDFSGDMYAQFDLTIIIVVCCMVLTTAIFMILIRFLVAPLTKLPGWMEDVGKLNISLPSEQIPTSRIVEVSAVIGAFTDLQEKLRTVKAFVPQAVLSSRKDTSSDDSTQFSDVGSISENPLLSSIPQRSTSGSGGSATSTVVVDPIVVQNDGSQMIDTKPLLSTDRSKSVNTTILFVDFGNCSANSASKLLDISFRKVTHRHGVVENANNSAVLASFNAHHSIPDHTNTAVKVAVEIVEDAVHRGLHVPRLVIDCGTMKVCTIGSGSVLQRVVSDPPVGFYNKLIQLESKVPVIVTDRAVSSISNRYQHVPLDVVAATYSPNRVNEVHTVFGLVKGDFKEYREMFLTIGREGHNEKNKCAAENLLLKSSCELGKHLFGRLCDAISQLSTRGGGGDFLPTTTVSLD